MSINRVIISGNLTRDGELRRTQSGTAILSIGVAVNDRRRDPQTGEWSDHANFVDAVLFGKRAESLAEYLVKGAKVCIEGKLRYSSWQDKSGQNRSKLEVVADEIELMSRERKQQSQSYGQPEYVESTVIDGNQGGVYEDIPW